MSIEMESIDDIIPIELLLLIAEQNNNIFVSLRLISRSAWNYTNEYIDLYKERFSILIKEGPFPFSPIDKILYRKLPNGNKHGSYRSYYRGGNLMKKHNYKDNQKEGTCRKYDISGELRKKIKYIKGVKKSCKYYCSVPAETESEL